MTVSKSALLGLINDIVERIVDGPQTMGINPIRLRETLFILDWISEEYEDNVKNIKLTGGGDDDEGAEPTLNMDLKEANWGGGKITIENLKDRFNREIDDAFAEDDDGERFEVELLKGEEGIPFVKDGNELTISAEDVTAGDELDLLILAGSDGVLPFTLYECDVNIIDSEA